MNGKSFHISFNINRYGLKNLSSNSSGSSSGISSSNSKAIVRPRPLQEIVTAIIIFARVSENDYGAERNISRTFNL